MTTSPLRVSNVKTDYGAVGNGTADDTTSFQNAFNSAWGTQSNPSANTIVYVPPGTYKITSPLYQTNHIGAVMLGAGSKSSVLLFQPTGTGNSIVANGITPCIMQDGMAYCTLKDFGIVGPGTNVSPAAAAVSAIYIYKSGASGQTTGNLFENIDVSYVGGGIWSDGGVSNCENMLLKNCWFDHCSYHAMRAQGFNTLNWGVFGGGASNCSVLSNVNTSAGTAGNAGAAMSIVNGGIQTIAGFCWQSNFLDICHTASQSLTVEGGSTSSSQFIFNAGQQAVVNGLHIVPPDSNGCSIFSFNTGFTQTSGCKFDPVANTGAGWIGHLGSNGELIMDGFQIGANGNGGAFSGSGSARVYMRGCNFVPLNANLWTSFTGTKVQDI